VVTGLGTVSAAGLGIGPTWAQMLAGPPSTRMMVGPTRSLQVSFPVFRTEDFDLAAAGVPPRALQWMRDEGLCKARDLVHLMAATGLALGDARLPADLAELDPPAAVIVGDESPGFEQTTQALFQLADDEAMPAEPMEMYTRLVDDFFQLNTFLLPYYLTRAFRFRGLGLYVNSACTSGLNALDLAVQEVRNGRSRIAVAAAGENPLSLAKYFWFYSLGMYSMQGVIRPFDRDQSGLVFGDGAAAVVVEDLEHARERGAPIYAEYLGAGFSQDGWKIIAPSPEVAAAASAMERTLAAAGLAPGEVDLVVPHGVGSPASDQYEAAMLHRVFGTGGGRWPEMTAFKPWVGHNLGGSALLEIALLIKTVAEGRVPPTPGHETPYARNPLPLLQKWSERPVHRALKLTCGFAGFYGAALLGRFDDDDGEALAARPPADPPEEP
jgi:3-oxoacyl-[acyl-carrier-protein] synthase II